MLAAMLRTVDEVVERLGGVAHVAEMVGVGRPAVFNAKARGRFPYRWHLPLLNEAAKLGLKISPAVINGGNGRAAQ